MNMETGFVKFGIATFAALAVLAGAGTARADIAVQDAPSLVQDTSGSASKTISYTVSAGAKVLVVELVQKTPSATPAFTWNGTTMLKGATVASSVTVRQITTFYLFTPAVGTYNLVGNSLGAAYWGINVFTLSGVDTSAGIKAGTFNDLSANSDNNANVTISGVVAGSAVVTLQSCNDDFIASAGGPPLSFSNFTFTGTGGTTASTLWTNDNQTAGTIGGGGLVTGLAGGSVSVTGTILPTGGLHYVRNVLAAVVFAPAGAGPAPAPVMGVQGNSNSITNGDATPTTAKWTDFGATNVAFGTVVRTFTITNTGNASLNLNGSTRVAVGGAQAAEFTVTSLPSTPVAVSSGTTFQVTFAPVAPGLRRATLSIANDDPTNNPYVFAIQGTGSGTGPVIGLQGNSISITNGEATPATADWTDFGSTYVAGGTVARTFTILNTGDATLKLSGSPLVAVSGAQAAEFTVTSQPATSVGVSSGTTFQVTFAPMVAGLRSATLSIANNNVSNNPYLFAIQGTGTGTVAVIPVTAKWCVGGSSIGWDATASWATSNTAATPHPTTVPGGADTVVFNITGQNTPMTVCLNANQAASGLVFRSTGTIAIPGVNVGAQNAWQYPTLDILTLGAGGIRITPGAGLVEDAIFGNNLATGINSLSMTLSADQTWMGPYGNSLLLFTTPVDGGGHNLTLVRSAVNLGNSSGGTWSGETKYAAFANMPSITLAEGATLGLYNLSDVVNTNRIGDATDIVSYGGSVSYPFITAGNYAARSETVHALQLVRGEFDHQQDGYPSLVNVFAYAGGLTRTGPAATLVFFDNGYPGRNYLGTTNGNANRVIFGGQPDTTFVGPWAAFAGFGFAGYSSTVDASGYPVGMYANGGTGWNAATNDPSGIVSTLGLGTVAVGYANPVVKALIFGGSMDLAGNALTITSGGLTFPGTGSDTLYDGTVTAGTGSDTNLYVFTAYSGARNAKVIGARIADNGAGKVGLVKSGAFALTLTNANTYSGNTTINNGTLYLATAGAISQSPVIELLYGNFTGQYYAGQPASGAQLDVSAQTSTWTLGASQTLKGNGVVIGNVNVNGTVAPGAGMGILSVTGNVTFANNATLKVNIQNAQNAGDVWGSGDSWNVGYGRLQVYGAVNLGAHAILNLEVQTNATLAISNQLFIVTGASAMAGQFKTPSGAVLNQGDTFTTGGRSYQISYTGKLASQAMSGGNDVVLQVQTLVPPKATVVLFR